MSNRRKYSERYKFLIGQKFGALKYMRNASQFPNGAFDDAICEEYVRVINEIKRMRQNGEAWEKPSE